MKFQNPTLKCVRTDDRMEGWTYKPKAICPFNFSNVGGIINELVSLFVWFVDLRPSQQLWSFETVS